MMRFAAKAAAVLLGLCVPALAQQATYVYTALGFQQITPVPTGTTLTVPKNAAGQTEARMAQICAETNDVRYRDDGTNPTASVGMVIPKATCIQYSGPLTAIAFIQATSPSTLDISYYR